VLHVRRGLRAAVVAGANELTGATCSSSYRESSRLPGFAKYLKFGTSPRRKSLPRSRAGSMKGWPSVKLADFTTEYVAGDTTEYVTETGPVRASIKSKAKVTEIGPVRAVLVTLRSRSAMVSKEKVLTQLDLLTDQLSTQVRTIAFGALAFAWGLLLGDSAVARSIAERLEWHLVAVGAMAVLTMSLDFAQYLAGYVNVLSLYHTMETAKTDNGEYDTSTYSFKFRLYLFYLKMISLGVTVLWLLSVLGYWLAKSAR
jgi:hypothetical protein